jgi:hypothetical protein
MTRGGVALPWKAVAEQKVFFNTSGGPRAHDHSGREDDSVAAEFPNFS